MQMSTWEAKLVYVLKVLLAVALSPQVADAAAPEAVLNTELDSLQAAAVFQSLHGTKEHAVPCWDGLIHVSAIMTR